MAKLRVEIDAGSAGVNKYKLGKRVCALKILRRKRIRPAPSCNEKKRKQKFPPG